MKIMHICHNTIVRSRGAKHQLPRGYGVGILQIFIDLLHMHLKEGVYREGSGYRRKCLSSIHATKSVIYARRKKEDNKCAHLSDSVRSE